MAHYNPNPSIKERGGLEAYMTDIGIDYALFRSLRDGIGDRYKAIADALTKQAKLSKALRPQRIKEWCRVDDEEKADGTSPTN